MKPPSHGGREYRVLALAVAFFLVGLFFFFRDNQPSPKTPPPSPQFSSVGNVTEAPGAAAGVGSYEEPLDPEFAGFPPPSKFRTFTYSAAGINGSSSFSVSSTCSAPYVAILAFPARVDYRSDVKDAAYNRAFPCGAAAIVDATITPADLAGAPYGSYYFFTADEGTSSVWYNPK